MRPLRTKTCWRIFSAACVLVVLPAIAGERIRFSGRDGEAATERFERRAALTPADFGLRPTGVATGSPVDSMLLPTPSLTPTTALSARQQELLEQRRNWLFQEPRKSGDPRSGGGPESARPDDTGPKSSIERFLEGPDRRPAIENSKRENDPSRSRPGDTSSKPGRTTEQPALNSKPSLPNAGGWEASARTQPRALDGALFSGQDFSNNPLSSRIGLEGKQRDREQDRSAQMDAFKRLLTGQTAGGQFDPAQGGRSPGTASELFDPSRRPAGAGAVPTAGNKALPGIGAGPGFDRSSPGALGLPNDFFKPEPPAAKPSVQKPIVLEIPKRKL